MPLALKSCFELEQIQQGAVREQGSKCYKQNRTEQQSPSTKFIKAAESEQESGIIFTHYS